MNKQYTGNMAVSTVLAFILIPLGGLSTDIYIPSLPSMAVDLSVSGNAVQLTLLLFMISAGVSQLFIGSILDSFGRYRISIAALLVFAVASLLIVVVNNLYLIYLMRVIQGLSVAMIVVGKRAYFADVYSGAQLIRYTGWFSIIWAIAPVTAPFIGGYMQKLFGWQSNFILLSVLAFVLLILELKFSRESIQQFTPFKAGLIRKVYSSMFRSADFSLGLLIVGLSYSLLVVYAMASPFIIEHRFGYSSVVTGYSSLVSGVSLMAGGLLSRLFSDKPLFEKLYWSIAIQALGAIAMLMTSFFSANLTLLICFTIPLHMLSGFIFNIVYSYCLRRFKQNAGTASGLTGGGLYVISSSIGYVMTSVIDIQHVLELSLANFSIVIGLSCTILFFIKAVSGRRAQEGVAVEV